MKKFLFLLLCLLLSTTLFSEDSNSTEPYKHYIGAGGGMTLGYGLTYRYWPEKFGYQVTFNPLWDGTDLELVLGTALMRTLHETDKTRLFLYLGGHYAYRQIEEIQWSQELYIETGSKTVISHGIGLGLGPGIELFLFDNFAIDIMFGYGFTEYIGLGFTAEGFLSYRF